MISFPDLLPPAVRNLWPVLRTFKQERCDENRIISALIRDQLQSDLFEPILDVGAGLGDIALAAFPDKTAILLDREDHSGPLSPKHTRMVGDFWNFASGSPQPVGAALFIHVLQYLDDDLQRLFDAVAKLKARRLLTVTNDNSGEFGDLVRWAATAIPSCNAETPIDFTQAGWLLHKAKPFSATVRYPGFSEMAEDFLAVLLDAPVTPGAVNLMEAELRRRLSDPQLTIAQTVHVYYEA